MRLKRYLFVIYTLLAATLIGSITSPASSQSDKLDALNQQVFKLYGEGKFTQAVPFAKKYMQAIKAKYGETHLEFANSLYNLASLYRNLGRYSEAEPLNKTALAITENKLGPDHPDVALNLNDLGLLYQLQGRFGQAEPLYKRTLAILKKATKPNQSDIATTLNNLAALYHNQGRYTQAEPLYKNVLAITEKMLGPNHPHVGTTLNNLGQLYQLQGRYHEAEPLYKRDLNIKIKALGHNHPAVAASLNNLAVLYGYLRRYPDAMPLAKRALAIQEKSLGPYHPGVALSLNNLAEIYKSMRRYKDAEPLYLRSLAIRKKTLGVNHPDVGHSLNTLAGFYMSQGLYKKAERRFKQQLKLIEKTLGPNHPEVTIILNNLADLYYTQARYELAHAHYKRANKIYFKRQAARITSSLKSHFTSRPKQPNWQKGSFTRQVSLLYLLNSKDLTKNTVFKEASFQISQWAINAIAANAIAQMAIRFRTNKSNISKIIRELQDLRSQWQSLDKRLVGAATKSPNQRNAKTEAHWRTQLKQIESRISKINLRLKQDFPEYATLVNPEPLTLLQVQKLIHPNEALISFLLAEKESFAWVVTKDKDPAWVKLPLGIKKIAEKVQALRCGLDDSTWANKASALKCQKRLNVTYTNKEYVSGTQLPFSLKTAHELYDSLFGQITSLIKDKQLIIVADDALTSLPFQVLVTKKTNTDFIKDAGNYRKVSWLGIKHPITMLPSVSSLKALRGIDKQNIIAKNPFIGFGNPLLTGRDGKDKSAFSKQSCPPIPKSLKKRMVLALKTLPAIGNLFRGRLANPELLRRQAPLPETTDELCTVANSLNVSKSHIMLGAKATEATVKQLSKTQKLKNYRYVHFATHGLIAGDLRNLAEPALLLTPPQKATDLDDGLLTASEVTNLKLNADWVILSACNTASGEKLGAEPFSGLARAFFYAGAKSLLVSHWAVNSEATVKLITKSFKKLQNNPQIGRAEALRRSMVALINDPSRSWNPHPSTWAPFVVVGEGAANIP